MAIIKLPSGKFQTKLQGTDGKWISRTFKTRHAAQEYDFQLKQQLREGTVTTSRARGMILDEYFSLWFETVHSRASKSWRKEQWHLYGRYVSPLIGRMRVESVFPTHVAKVLNGVASIGRSECTQLHVFILMRKLFKDANEIFRLLTYNPVQTSLKPRIPSKEAAHLNIEEVRKLLTHVKEKPYGEAIWLQLYMGLRVGELQALTWTDIDLCEGVVNIRRTYVRKERVIRDYPKGRKHHSHRIPIELLDLLRCKREKAISTFVVTSPTGEMLSYEWYFRSLVRYCKALGITRIGTHGIRHSTSTLYLSHGAHRDDIRELFAHSSSAVTERYLHNHRGTNLEKVAKVIRLFPESSMDLPRNGLENIDKKKGDRLSIEDQNGFATTGP